MSDPAIVTPPAAPAAGGTIVTPAPPAAPAADWTAALEPEMRGFVQNRGFADPKTLLESYRNLEKVMGAPKERLLTLPEKMDDASMAPIFERLGRPKTPAEYKIAPKEGGDPKFLEAVSNWFHEAGLSTAQAEKIAAKWTAFGADMNKVGLEAKATAALTEQAALKREWGAAYEQNLDIARNAAKTFGLDAETLTGIEAVLGFSKTHKFALAIGVGLGEGKFVTGGPSSFKGTSTPEQALNKLETLKQDKAWVDRYLAGGAAEKEEFTRLHEQAYPAVT